MSEAIQVAGMVETSEDKHLCLNRAIKDIDNVLDQVNSINRRIIGEDCQPVGEVEKIHNKPALLEILNGGSSRINDVVNQIHQALTKLEDSLF